MSHQRIAVIGGGVAGVSAAWLLARRFHVTLIEANDYVGGHTNTVDYRASNGVFPVDTGFIVYNEANYPNLTALFKHLALPTQASDMSLAVSLDGGALEYAGDNLSTLFAQRRNTLRPRFWAMVRDILRFNRAANNYLDHRATEEQTLGEFLDGAHLGEAFRTLYLLPMSAAIWSCPQESMLAFPAARFLYFLRNHGLIQLHDRPTWRTVAGGGREYIRRMRPAIPRVLRNTPVTRVQRSADGVYLSGPDGEIGCFDQAIIATHADQALAMLDTPSYWEQRLLGAFSYQRNAAWVHSDTSLMPQRRRLWASWNHLGTSDVRIRERPTTVSYWMNRLQPLPTQDDVLVTLNPQRAPRDELVQRRFTYEHPMFDTAATRAQGLLKRLQGEQRTWFCGSYFGYGFHEDALTSALYVAEGLGVTAPWKAHHGGEGAADAELPESFAGASA